MRTNVTSPDVSPGISNHKTTNPFKNTSECLVFCPTNISLAEQVKSTNTVQIWKRSLIAYMGGMAGIMEGSYSYTCPMATQRNAAPRQQTIPLKNRPELWTPCSNQNTQQDFSPEMTGTILAKSGHLWVPRVVSFLGSPPPPRVLPLEGPKWTSFTNHTSLKELHDSTTAQDQLQVC